MAINRLGSKESVLSKSKSSDEDMKPLIREYCKDNPEAYGQAHKIISGRISKQGNWCMLDTEDYVLLIKSSASAVQELYNEILPALNGKKANILVCEPVKKDRYGGCIGVDDAEQGYYTFDEKELTFEITKEKPPSTKKQGSLTLEMFLDIASSSTTGQQTDSNTELDSSTIAGQKRTKKTIS